MTEEKKNKKPNFLAGETSPYLLQHAYNPVEWHPWGEVALQKAKDEKKPILVSIGYAACHWCHVMERESFEDESTATLMNEHFVNIKIDREERPDLDHIYMDAVQTMTGSGGWPLNVFLTPDKKPFYGGTYFPPQPTYGRASWKDTLRSLADAWETRNAEIEIQAESLVQHLQKAGDFTALGSLNKNAGNEFLKDACEEIAVALLKTADKVEGGFGAAPKFLQTPSITFLLEHAHYFENEEALAQAELSLLKMIQGGIYDQVGGGISRYSTDDKWLMPHFEKMLYDNALLLSALSEAYHLTGKDIYKEYIIKTFEFLLREMKDDAGGFYAALDADSDGVEGKFYVWEKKEILELLGTDADSYCNYFNVHNEGNLGSQHKEMEGKNILHITNGVEDAAKTAGILSEIFRNKMDAANGILLEARAERVRPQTDTKIILSWNALIVTAFCKCYAATGIVSFLEEAKGLQLFIEENFKSDEFYYGHAVTDGQLKNPAFLDDLSFYIQACIALQEVTGNEEYLNKADDIGKYVCLHFSDEEELYFYFTSNLQQDILLRKKELNDGATPSSNAAMASSLLYLAIVFNNINWQTRGEKMLQLFQNAIFKYPSSFGEWAKTYQLMASGRVEIAVVGKDFAKLLQNINKQFLPGKILQATEITSEMSLLKGKETGSKLLIYVCKNYACNAPVERVEDMLALIKK